MGVVGGVPTGADNFYYVALNVVHYITCSDKNSIWEGGGPGVRDRNMKLKWGTCITSNKLWHIRNGGYFICPSKVSLILYSQHGSLCVRVLVHAWITKFSSILKLL